jgi:hypothetical protein
VLNLAASSSRFAPGVSGGGISSGGIREKNLGDLIGAVERCEVAGLAEGHVVRSGQEGLVRGPV